MRTLLIPPAFLAVYAVTLGAVAALTLPSWNLHRPDVCYATPKTFAAASLLPEGTLLKPAAKKVLIKEERIEELAH